MRKLVIITDDQKFVTRDSSKEFVITDNIHRAKTYESVQKAENAIKTLPVSLKEQSLKIVDKKNLLEGVLTEVNLEEQNRIEDIKNVMASFEKELQQIVSRKQNLLCVLSEIDKEITDIEHYIEFQSFSASDGYKLAKALQKCRGKRRIIKDQIDVIDIIKDASINSVASGKISQRINQMDNRKYAPRVLEDLLSEKKKVS